MYPSFSFKSYNRTMKTRVLVVDDDALLRRSLNYRLDREGYAVVTCETAAEGLLCARRDPPALVLLDIGLPDQSGRAHFSRSLAYRLFF